MTTTSKKTSQSKATKTLKSTLKTPKITSSQQLIKEIRRNTRKIFNAEQKVLIVMGGIRGELSVSELARKYAISTQPY